MPFVKPSLEQQITTAVKDSIEVSLDVNWLLTWVTENFDAEDIYPPEHLAAWAERAGYVSAPDTDEEEQRVRY